jgi:hypothetical protein
LRYDYVFKAHEKYLLKSHAWILEGDPLLTENKESKEKKEEPWE